MPTLLRAKATSTDSTTPNPTSSHGTETASPAAPCTTVPRSLAITASTMATVPNAAATTTDASSLPRRIASAGSRVASSVSRVRWSRSPAKESGTEVSTHIAATSDPMIITPKPPNFALPAENGMTTATKSVTSAMPAVLR